jgi:hypothetical protein
LVDNIYIKSVEVKAFKDTAQYYDIEKNKNTTYKDFIISQLS